MDNHARPIEQMLNGVHGQAREWPDIDVVVMQIMRPLIKRPPMADAMNGIKMEITDQRDQAHHQNEIDRMLADRNIGDQVIGIEPHRDHFIGRPDGNGTEHGPKQIIKQLIAKEEDWIVTRQPFVGVFPIGALRFFCIEPKVPSTGNKHNED